MNLYHVFTADFIEDAYEDPSRCPLYWRGSGCYDISIYNYEYHRFTVAANSGQEAVAFLEDKHDAIVGWGLEEEGCAGQNAGVIEDFGRYVDDDAWTEREPKIAPFSDIVFEF